MERGPLKRGAGPPLGVIGREPGPPFGVIGREPGPPFGVIGLEPGPAAGDIGLGPGLPVGVIERPLGPRRGGPRGSLGPGWRVPLFVGRGLTGFDERQVRGATPC